MNNPRLDIVFYTQGLDFDNETALEGPLGGSETAVGCLASELAKKGHKVRVFCHTTAKEPEAFNPENKVEYRHVRDWEVYARNARPDVLIVSRHLPALKVEPQINAGITYVWMHDCMTDEFEPMLFGALYMVDGGLIVNSNYHQKQIENASEGLQDFIDEADRQGWPLIRQIGLGIGDDHIEDLPYLEKRKPKQLLYSSRPERGLLYALDVLDRLNTGLEGDDCYKLKVVGYAVPTELIGEREKFLYQELYHRMAENPNVERLGGLKKKDLYKLMRESAALLYPTQFPEIFCLTTMEAAWNNLPIITTQDFAIAETVPHSRWIDVYAEDGEEFIRSATERVLELGSDDMDTKVAIDSSVASNRKHVWDQGFTWSKAATKWEDMIFADFHRRLEKDPLAVARGLYQESDLIAALDLLENPKEYGTEFKGPKKQQASMMKLKLRKEIDFLESDESYAKYYDNTGEEDPHGHAVKNRRSSSRGKMLLRTLKALEDEKTLKPDFKFLDWGCGTGFACLLVREVFPKAEITGYDLSSTVVARGEKLTKKYFNEFNKKGDSDKDPDIHFISHLYPDGGDLPKYDVIFLGEVLEHVRDPKKFIEENIFPRLNPGGWFLGTVPRGPWEANSFKDDDRRFHVRSYQNLDIEDLVSCTKDNLINLSYGGLGIHANALGWIFFGMRPDEKTKIEQFTYEKHILTQKPWQTVSACIIAKDRPQLLWRMLDNITDWVDQIIIVDTGSKDPKAIQIMKDYATTYIKGPSPLDVGFSVPRNLSVSKATGDWIFWIDTDEYISKPQNLRKYLRINPIMGYVVLQKHLTGDGAHDEQPDTPCRLFRADAPIEFLGLIHEQPELGFDKPIKPTPNLSDLSILHDGYYDEQQRQGRFLRNVPLLLRELKEFPERLLTKALLIRDYTQFGKFKIQVGQDEAAVVNLENALRYYDKYFRGEGQKGPYFKIAFKYYQEALLMLGRGFGFGYSMTAGPRPITHMEANTAEMNLVMFQSPDEAKEYFAHEVDYLAVQADRRKNGEKVYNLRPGGGRTSKGTPVGNSEPQPADSGNQSGNDNDSSEQHRHVPDERAGVH